MSKSEPLVSVMTPAYNAADTLPWALASLRSQSWQHWECVLVDDGSTDHTLELVEALNDARVRVIALPENRGRGIARQVALNNVRGDLVCMLDADDWIHPDKLRQQVEVFESHPTLSLVATGVGITGADGDLVGARVRGGQPGQIHIAGPVRQLDTSPVSHATAMMRRNELGHLRYDPRFRLAQDSDFLIRFLLGRQYAVIGSPLYMYSEPLSVTETKILESLRYSVKLFGKHRHRFPLQSRVQQGKAVAKQAVYRAAFSFGLKEWLIARRSHSPTTSEKAFFNQAREAVRSCLTQD